MFSNFFIKKKNIESIKEEDLKNLQNQIDELRAQINKNEEVTAELTEQILRLSDMIQIIATAHAELANDMTKIYNSLSGHIEKKSSSSLLSFPFVLNDDDDLIN